MRRRVNIEALGDTLLHPVRLQILRCFELNGAQTAGELARKLPSITQPTLYRHLKALADAGVLKSQEMRQGDRGAPERVYELATDVAQLTIHPKGKERTPERLRRYYLALLAAQTAEFDAALREGTFPEKYFTVRHSVVHVNDAELAELQRILTRLGELSGNDPTGRISLNLGIAVFPVKRSTKREAR